MWVVVVLIPDHCLSIYFVHLACEDANAHILVCNYCQKVLRTSRYKEIHKIGFSF